MAIKDDDTVPESYTYFWDKETSEVPLKDFLTKVRTEESILQCVDIILTHYAVQAVYGPR